MQLSTCRECHSEFLAKTRRATLCDTCYQRYLRSDRSREGHRKVPVFRAIDGEGIGDDYVLLGVGQNQAEWPNGVKNIAEIFDFLYRDFLDHKDAYYGGFYLSYDWNNWLKLLPMNRIGYLIDPALIKKRQRHSSPVPFPVRHEGWEFDWLPGKRFKLRPEGENSGWMYICDFGPFFQMSLLKALETRSAQSNITDEQVAIIREGKSKRATAQLDDEMRYYNRLENYALEELMLEVDHSLSVLGTPLGKTEFHGPGQAAQKWILKQSGIQEANKAVLDLDPEIYDAIVASYYGGIFEITTHGHVPGTSYEYDINSAYPHQISTLPCTCGEWVRVRKGDSAIARGRLVLMHGRFEGSNQWLGPLPFRNQKRGILRPLQGRGWYWDFEVAAAMRAGILDSFEADEYVVYLGCGHGRLLEGIRHLYDERIRVGKETTMGKGCKLIYNSAYGKFAQSVGNPQAANAVYASLITAGCRAQILDAIATHPMGADALLMIATDAVFFSMPHPGLTLSNKLGEWGETVRENLTIFKPGMYWDDSAREAIRAGTAPVFKARGVNAKDFAAKIFDADVAFATFAIDGGEWPEFALPVAFTQVSVKQAYNRAKKKGEEYYKQIAGMIITGMEVLQSSDPVQKRNTARIVHGMSIRTTPYQGEDVESVPYDERFGRPENELAEYIEEDMPLDTAIAEALQLR